jgi:predicted HicB family RNase H-like nuclease
MKTKRGRGRPPKLPGEGLGKTLQLRLSESEHAEWTRAAERANMVLSAWIRRVLAKEANAWSGDQPKT